MLNIKRELSYIHFLSFSLSLEELKCYLRDKERWGNREKREREREIEREREKERGVGERARLYKIL